MALQTAYSLVTGGTTGHPSRRNRRTPYKVSVTFSIADALAAKGSSLVAGDWFNAITLPANTGVLGGAIELITAANSQAGAVVVSVGTAGDDTIVDSAVITDGTAAGWCAGTTTNARNMVTTTAAGNVTIKLEVTSVSASTLSGTFKVHCLLVDLT